MSPRMGVYQLCDVNKSISKWFIRLYLFWENEARGDIRLFLFWRWIQSWIFHKKTPCWAKTRATVYKSALLYCCSLTTCSGQSTTQTLGSGTTNWFLTTREMRSNRLWVATLEQRSMNQKSSQKDKGNLELRTVKKKYLFTTRLFSFSQKRFNPAPSNVGVWFEGGSPVSNVVPAPVLLVKTLHWPHVSWAVWKGQTGRWGQIGVVNVKILEGERKWDWCPLLWFGSPLTARDDLRTVCRWEKSPVRKLTITPKSQIQQQADTRRQALSFCLKTSQLCLLFLLMNQPTNVGYQYTISGSVWISVTAHQTALSCLRTVGSSFSCSTSNNNILRSMTVERKGSCFSMGDRS